MTDIPARELRNNVIEVLRRVEAGECMRVLVSGRPVAELRPLAERPASLPFEEFERGLAGCRADPGLAADLRKLLPETTGDAWPVDG